LKRQRVLITIDWFLPGTKSGGPVRSYANMIDHLSQFYDFLIITRDTDYCSEKVYDSIHSDSWNRYNEHTSIYYFSKENLTRNNLAKLIKNTEFDILYVNGIYSWFFSILPILLVDKKHKTIVSARGMLNAQAFSVKKFKKKLFLILANAMKLYKNVDFHATNRDEAIQIESHIKCFKDMYIAPNLPRKTQGRVKDKQKHDGPTRFVNIARVSVEKGTLKMIQTMRTITSNVILDIYGPIYDSEYWNRCQNSISELPENLKVEYKGVLASEDVPNALNDYDYLILLSEGENFGHAIIEALSSGLPVLISSNTPWKDLESKSIGWDVNIEKEEEIINAINKATQMSPLEYSRWSQAALEFADEFTQNPELIAQNRALFLNS